MARSRDHIVHPHEQISQQPKPEIYSFDDDGEGELGDLPTEHQLLLLCLDYLRELRRSYPQGMLEEVEGLNADYLSIAIYALSRSFIRVDWPKEDGTDCFFDQSKQITLKSPPQRGNVVRPNQLPSLSEINREILFLEKPLSSRSDDSDEAEKKNDPPDDNDEENPLHWYEYDDMHPSNSQRFYPLNGLASGPGLKGPLSMGELVSAGIAGLGARSRVEAEKAMIQSPLFEQFVQAVRSKGFFIDPDNDTPQSDPEEERLRLQRKQRNYEDRYRKVVAKFRTKLAVKAESAPPAGSGKAAMPSTPVGTFAGALSNPANDCSTAALSAADRHRRRRSLSIQNALMQKHGKTGNTSTQMAPMTPNRAGILSITPRGTPTKDAFSPMHARSSPNVESTSPRNQDNPRDIDQAERFKTEGNAYMQRKQYSHAVASYTQALKLSPSGPHSHVYFSNRAAALLSMKRFPDAILDSERALALKPDYGKAHARLGLAHFLLGNYRQAMEAYTVSLKYDPNNTSARAYLEKAAKKVAEKGGTAVSGSHSHATSFSLVSEWDSQKQQDYHSSPERHHHASHEEDRSRSDQREAEKCKTKGNAHMANREYGLALEAYTQAIQFSPNGPQSHVYYSNRAAALCYLEKYLEAIQDSERSLSLNPSYGKAYARLGLSRFFLQDYAGAVEAYTAALKHDPENAASKSYLAKARAKLEARQSS